MIIMTIKYVLQDKKKHSVRYKRAEQHTKRDGPDSMYVPNEFFEDATNPPAELHMSLTK